MGTLAFTVVAWLALGAEPPVRATVSLSVAPEVLCVTEPGLARELQREGVALADAAPLDVDVSAVATGLRLRARRIDDGRLFVRTVPAKRGACASVEQAVVLLIREWASSPTIATPVATPRVSATPARPARVATVPPPPVVVEEPAPLDAGVPEPIVEDAGVEVMATPVSAPQPPAPQAPNPFSVRLAVGGGISGGTVGSLVPAGSLVLDVGHGAFGISLDGTIEGGATQRGGVGQVEASLQWITLSARWRFDLTQRLGLDVGLGVRGSRLVASASGFTTNTSVSLLSAGPAATATLWVNLVGPLRLLVRPSIGLRLPADSLIVADGPTFTISALQLSAIAGLAVAWP